MSTTPPVQSAEFFKKNRVGYIIMNRPKQLNALNLEMIDLMQQHLTTWEKDDSVHAIVIKGAGDVAFCAGGDVKQIREACLRGEGKLAATFFKREYLLNMRVSSYPKPYVALMNGITMGGGVGVSVHGDFRVATEKTLFAMPETAIGFFADVGGSHFMSRLKNNIGKFLVLTGNRLKGEDVQKTGIATHYIHSSRMGEIEEALTSQEKLSKESIGQILDKLCEKPNTQVSSFDTAKIDQIFKSDSYEEIVEHLKKEDSTWSKTQLGLLAKMSPTSLKVTMKQLALGSKMSLEDCFEMEYLLAQRFMESSDFVEGVRAVLVDRGDKPKWNPPTTSDITQEKVDWYFKRQPSDDSLYGKTSNKL